MNRVSCQCLVGLWDTAKRSRESEEDGREWEWEDHPLLSISLQITFLRDPVRSLRAFLMAELTLS